MIRKNKIKETKCSIMEWEALSTVVAWILVSCLIIKGGLWMIKKISK